MCTITLRICNEVAYVFLVMPSKYFRAKKETIPFDELRVVGPLAKKLEVRQVVGVVVHRLSRCFPSQQLLKWDPELKTTRATPPVAIRVVDAIAAVGLARTLDAPQLLPMAFYTCCSQLRTDSLLKGVSYGPDGAETVHLDRKSVV